MIVIALLAFSYWNINTKNILNHYQLSNKTSAYFETIKNSNSSQLYNFLYSMPKGADLHSHFAGAAMAENLIKYALGQGFCLDNTNYSVYQKISCNPLFSLDTLLSMPLVESATVDAWSMRYLNDTVNAKHKHFFDTFEKFYPIIEVNQSQVLAEIMNRAGKQNVLHLELMTTPYGENAATLGSHMGWNKEMSLIYNRLISSDLMSSIVEKVHWELDKQTIGAQQLMKCGSESAQPGCKVNVGYLYQVIRNQAPEKVFAQFIVGFEAAIKYPEVLGINLVGPEDNPIALKDYKLHMQMIKFLKQKYPHVKVSLHAGELTADFVNPKELTYHIESAVGVAGAERIGHGVDIKNEASYLKLLSKMAKHKILVEINLTSNKAILAVDKISHPLPIYLKYNIPIGLSTDDEGILRTDLTTQYVIAARDYNLTYSSLKNISRNTLEYSFITGSSLWSDQGKYRTVNHACNKDNIGELPSSLCRNFLNNNKKAALEWDLENRFIMFERQFQ